MFIVWGFMVIVFTVCISVANPCRLEYAKICNENNLICIIVIGS